MQLAQRGDLGEVKKEQTNKLMKDFEFDEDNMICDVISSNSFLLEPLTMKNENISLLKPLSRVIPHKPQPEVDEE